MPALAIMFSPHVCLNSSAERFTAWIGPTCSITSTGSTRNVTSDHASPTSEPTIRPDDARRAPRWPGARATRWRSATAHGSSTCDAGAGRVNRLADRDRLAAQALVGREHERGVEEHDDVRDREVADDAEDPRERLRRALRAVVGDERDRPEEHERDDAARDSPESSGSTVSFLSSRSTFHDDFARSIEFCSRPTGSSSDGYFRRIRVLPRADPDHDARVRRLGRWHARRESDRFDAVRGALGDAVRRRPIRAGAGPGQPDRRPHRLPGRALPADRDRPRRARSAFRPRADGRVHVRSLDLDADVDARRRRRDRSTPRGRVRSPATLARARRRARPRRLPGFDAAITSTVPIGSGLSSSAAFEVALALVDRRRSAASTLDADRARARRAGGRATRERRAVRRHGPARVGRRAGRARAAPRLPHARDHAGPDPGRRSACSCPQRARTAARDERVRRAARRVRSGRRAALGVATLRDATIEQVADDPIARHVVTENARVAGVRRRARATATSRPRGALMLASHRSLRDDFAVSTPELDLLVDLSVDAGAFGARLTGAGFGGCVVALVEPRATSTRSRPRSTDRYRSETGREPNAFAVTAVDGAGLVEPH